MEQYREDKAILGAMRPLILNLGSRIQQGNSLTIDDLELVRQCLTEAGVDQGQIEAVNSAIQSKFSYNLTEVPLSGLPAYLNSLPDSNANTTILRHFINRLRLDERKAADWHESNYNLLQNLSGDVAEELKYELEIGFKY